MSWRSTRMTTTRDDGPPEMIGRDRLDRLRLQLEPTSAMSLEGRETGAIPSSATSSPIPKRPAVDHDRPQRVDRPSDLGPTTRARHRLNHQVSIVGWQSGLFLGGGEPEPKACRGAIAITDTVHRTPDNNWRAAVGGPGRAHHRPSAARRRAICACIRRFSLVGSALSG